MSSANIKILNFIKKRMSKRTFKAKSILLLITLLFLSLYSCKRIENKQSNIAKDNELFSYLKKQSLFYSKSNNDSAIFYVNSAINLMVKMDYHNSDTLYSLLKIKARSFQNKGEFDSVIVFLEKYYKEAEEQSETLLQAETAILLGSIALDEDNLYYVERYIPKAIKLLEITTNEYYRAKAYSVYGVYLGIKGNNKEAIKYLLKAYKVFDKLNMYADLAFASINIGNNYNAIGSKEERLNYYKIAVDAAIKSNDTVNLMIALTNVGLCYRKTLPDSARYYYDKVIAIKPVTSSNSPVLSTKYNKANLYLDKKDYNKAIEIYNEILTECKRTKNYIGIAHIYSGFSSIAVSMHNTTQAIDYLKSAIIIADSIGQTNMKMLLKDQLQSVYEENANYKEAYLLSKELKVFNDSTKSIDKQIAIRDMVEIYQKEKKELENKLLKSELTKKDKLLINRYIIIVLLFIISLVLGVLLWRIITLYKQRSFAFDVLMKKYMQESELKKEYDEVTDVSTKAIFDSEDTTVEAEIIKPTDTSLMQELVTYFKNQKPYLNPKLKVEDVAEILNSSRKNIAMALHEHNHSNFASFTNAYRVEHAKELMLKHEYKNYKTEEVGFMSGFGSKQNFYMVFRQVTGLQPSYFHQNVFTSMENK